MRRFDVTRVSMLACFVVTMFLLAAAASSAAQTPLAQYFQLLRSKDPADAQQASKNWYALLTQEMPIIDKDSATVCNALRDPDPQVRLSASGVLVVIAVAKKEHAGVIQACIPELLVEARDLPMQKPKHPGDDLAVNARNNALYALALNPLGTPPQAEAVFRDQLKSDNLRSAELAAAGLLRLQGPDAAANQKLVADALNSAPDSKHRLNLLYAISGVESPSDAVFQATRPALNDPDPEIQRAAVEALVNSAPDKSQAISALQNLEGSPTAATTTKEMAKSYAKSLSK